MQCQSKLLIIALVILSFLQSVLGLKLGLTPSHMNIISYTSETYCTNITISSDKDVILYPRLTWSSYYSTNILDYIISSNTLDIGQDINTMIYLSSRKKTFQDSFCLRFNRPGYYYGALVYTAKDYNLAVGAWIYAEIRDKDQKHDLTIYLSYLIIVLFVVLALLLKINYDRSFSSSSLKHAC